MVADTKFKPGERTVGRQKGTPNKTTVTAKQAIQSVYDRLQQGHEDPHGHFVDWATENPSDFYAKIYPRLLPVQTELSGPDGGPLQVSDEVARERLAQLMERVKP